MDNKLIKFSEGWLEKALNYDTKKLSGCFDKFFTLFVVYNALYNHATDKLLESNRINKGQTRDRKSAVSNAPNYIGFDELEGKFRGDERTEEAVNKIVKLIEDGIFYISCDRNGSPNHKNDTKLINRIKNKKGQQYVESIMDLIYTTRCNMFHGSKNYDKIQANLLQPMIVILNFIVKILLDKLKQPD